MRYFIADGDDRKGPFTPEELARQGIERGTLVWHEGMPDWRRADQVPALTGLLGAVPPPVPRRQPPPRPEYAEADSFGRWVRYNPGTFKKLFLWFVILLGAALTLAAVSAVLVIISHNMRVASRQVNVWDPVMQRNVVRWDFDRSADRLRSNLEALGVIGFIAAGLMNVAAGILFLVTLYKSWNQIQDGRARTGAGAAVGLMFVPFFNLYWIFVAIYGLALDLHRYVTRHRLIERVGPFPLSPGVALTFCILMVCSMIPFVNFVTMLPVLVVQIILMAQLRRAGAGIAAARLAPEGVGEDPTEYPAPSPEEAHPERVTRRPDGRG